MRLFPLFNRLRVARWAMASVVLASAPAIAQEVVKIGYSGPMSGGAAQYGRNVLDGMQMAVAELNAHPLEINGKTVKFEVVALDDKYNPSESAINAQRLVQQHKAPAVLVPHSGGIFALQNINERSGFIVLGYSSVPQITEKGNKLTLRISPLFTDFIEPFSKYQMQRFGKKVALVTGDHDYAKAWSKAFREGWEKMGGTVVAENPMSYNKEADFYSGVSRALNAKPDVLLVGGASEPTALVVKQAKELGFKGGFIAIDQAKLEEMARVVGGFQALEGTVGVLPLLENKSPANAGFVARFQNQFPDRPAGLEAQLNYSAVHALGKAMQLAGSTSDTKAIHAQLDAAYKALPAERNPARVGGVNERGGTLTNIDGAAIEQGNLVLVSTKPSK